MQTTIENPGRFEPMVRCGIIGFAGEGTETDHPVYGRIKVIHFFGYAAGTSLVDAIRLNPNEPTLLEQL